MTGILQDANITAISTGLPAILTAFPKSSSTFPDEC
jgi:hypothetical protein